ncbi:MAG: cellulase family glycosylhydrolase [Proteobacteria bacterium]|nr:cellulase family glycosylhydrolase [Pseudomonadota bacterium]
MTAYKRKQLGYSLTALAGACLLLMAAAPVTAADTVSPAAIIQTSENTAESPSPRLPRWLRQLLRVSPANAAATTNASGFVGQSVPGSLQPGETRTVSVTMKNVGSTTWTGGGNYKLGTQNPQDNRRWTGVTRIYLAPGENIRPGQNKTFTFGITAPAKPGTYDFQWRMVQEGVEWFGAFTTNVGIIVDTTLINASQYVGQSVSGSLKPGETTGMSVIMRNTGTSTWTRASGYKLGSENPQDTKKWGLNRVYLSDGEEIKPGQTKTFTFDITAPTKPGAHDLQWRMVQDGVEWFGEYTLNVKIRVDDLKVIWNDAYFVAQVVPTVMAPGETKRVSITMRNIGFSTWTRADDYKLGSENPQDNKEWGRNRVYLSDGDEVKPGKTKTFAFDITAPTTPGSKDFQWRMVKDGDNSGWFGNRSINRVIEVTGEQESPDTSRFGVVAAPGIGDDPSRVDRVQALGVGWVRVAYDWNDMQPTRNGPIQWDLAERIVTRLSDIGVKIYWDFSYAPGWANGRPTNHGSDRTYPPLDQQDLYNFVHAVVTRFKGRVDYWGTWNEPNLPQFYKGSVYRFVARELPTTLRAIRDADPSAKIVVGELSSSRNPYGWLQRILSSARGQFDVISHHVYDGGDSCGGRTRMMDELRSKLVRWGFQDKPVWITETGLNESENRKSAFLTCFYDQMETRPWWTKTFWYRLEHEPGLNWSLLNRRGEPKQSYRTYQDYIRGGPRLATLPPTPLPSQTFWQDDNFDNLIVGKLNRQAGWFRAAKRASAMVVPSDDGNAVELDPRAGTTIVMGKDIVDQLDGQHAFSLRVKVTGTDSPSVAKIEFGTRRNLGWDKKFQIFFGNSMRVNYGADGRAVQFLSATEPERWYTIAGDIDLDRDILDIAVDGILAAQGIPIHPGPMTSLGLSAWDRPGAVTLDDFQGSRLDIE